MRKPKIYIIHPVTNATPQQTEDAHELANILTNGGFDVYLPGRDTDQQYDAYRIMKINSGEILSADAIFVLYDPNSRGVHFDLGVAITSGAPIYIVMNESESDFGVFYSELAEHVFTDLNEVSEMLPKLPSLVAISSISMYTDACCDANDYHALLEKIFVVIDKLGDLMEDVVIVNQRGIRYCVNRAFNIMQRVVNDVGNAWADLVHKNSKKEAKPNNEITHF